MSFVMKDALTIKIVAKLSGVSEHTLRAWERRYKAVIPKRTSTGRRIYSFRDVERLKHLNEVVGNGYSIGAVARLPNDQLESLSRKISFNIPNQIIPAIEPPTHLSPSLTHNTRQTLLDALRRYEMDEVGRILLRARGEHGIRSLVLELISPLFAEVGQMVAHGTLNIAQEHSLSAVIRNHLGQLIQSMAGATDKSSICIIFSTPENELHEFGILLASMLGLARGCRSHYLGPNIPPIELAKAATSIGSHIVVLGTSPSATQASSLVRFSKYISQLSDNLPKSTEIWIGGSRKVDLKNLHIPQQVRRVESLQMFDELIAKVTSELERPRK